jgi:hypothetical protein
LRWAAPGWKKRSYLLAAIYDEADENQPFQRPEQLRGVIYSLMEDATLVGACVMFQLLTAR